MKICIFNHDHIGIVEQGRVFDVTLLFDLSMRWPTPLGDAVVAQLGSALGAMGDLATYPVHALDAVHLESPVANPGKIIGAPVNYHAHIAEANADAEINTGKTYTTLEAYGVFLKANSALIGPCDDFHLTFGERRTDHEVELVAVIGKTGRDIRREDALDYVAAYTVGLDMTVRGPEVACYRKSPDGYCILGPWLVTPDEVGDPDDLAFSLSVNGEIRQQARTSQLILGVARLIEYSSQLYTLHPGDLIMTGTPAGVGPVVAGDLIHAEVEKIGALHIAVHPPISTYRKT